MVIINGILSIVVLTAIFIVITFVFGLLYMGIGNLNSRYVQRNWGWKGICVFGVIGVPFHEFTHFITALLFLHKIDDVCLFRPIKGKQDGQLGYVKHSYKKTLYRTGGNVVIGAAPMIFGALVIFLIIKKFFPGTFINIITELDNGSTVKDIALSTLTSLKSFFSISHLKSIWFYVCLLVTICIGCHMNMSPADVKGSLTGVIALLAFSAAFPMWLSWRGIALTKNVFAVMLGLIIQYTYILSVIFIIDIFMMLFFLILSVVRGRTRLSIPKSNKKSEKAST